MKANKRVLWRLESGTSMTTQALTTADLQWAMRSARQSLFFVHNLVDKSRQLAVS